MTEPAADSPNEGSAVLVVGTPSQRREYCLSRLAEATETAVILCPSEPPEDLFEAYVAAGGTAPLRIGVDGPATEEGTFELSARTVPAIGEAGLAALRGKMFPPADRLWLDTPPIEFAADLQSAYRLIHVLTQRIRDQGAVAWFSLDENTDSKARRILSRPLEYEVTFERDETALGNAAAKGP
jgi:hypothetical protein